MQEDTLSPVRKKVEEGGRLDSHREQRKIYRRERRKINNEILAVEQERAAFFKGLVDLKASGQTFEAGELSDELTSLNDRKKDLQLQNDDVDANLWKLKALESSDLKFKNIG